MLQNIYIGAIALLYNDVEEQIDEMCDAVLRIPINPSEVLSRVYGMDGKVDIVKECAAYVGFEGAELAAFAETLGGDGFGRLKGWRDAVVHARIFDMDTSVARTQAKKGKRSEVLLAIKALRGLFLRLESMRVELLYLKQALQRKARIKRGEIPDPHKEQLEQAIQVDLTQFREHQSRRLSLPPMPEFPADIPNIQRIREILASHAQRH